MKYQTKQVVCSKTGIQCELKSFKYGKTRRYTEDTKIGAIAYLDNGGSKKDLIDAMNNGGKQSTAYTNLTNWRKLNFENPVAYASRVPKESQSTRYENSTLSRLRKLLGF